MQTAIKTLFMRGGTSRGPFFAAADLPTDKQLRDQVLLAVMGSPDPRQIDGLGGAHPLTSKVGIVSPGTLPGVDLDFLFAQLQPETDTVDYTPNCGNMLAAVVPYALETGMIKASADSHTARVLTLNTNMQCDVTVSTPQGHVSYSGSAHIDGVPGSSAPVLISFLDTAGSVCDALLPTGQVLDRFDAVPGTGTIEATCIDNGMPLVLLRASDVHCTGHESAAELNANDDLKHRLNSLRLVAAERMGLGDVSDKNYPKMTLISEAAAGGSIATRSFIPHVCHEAIGVLAAVTVATACVLEGSVAHAFASVSEGNSPRVVVEHPSGEFSVELSLDRGQTQSVTGAALLRTARLIMRGEVMIPASVWDGCQQQKSHP